MPQKIEIGLFEKLSLRDWYKYLLYISGILLILAIFLDTKIERYKIIDFSMWTIGLSIFVWLSDTILRVVARYYEIERQEDSPISEEEKWTAAIMMFVNVVAFVVWVLFIASKIF